MSSFPIRREQDCLIVELQGRLTAHDHFRFLQTAAQLADDTSGWVILDFSLVESLEAAAYHGLAHIFQLTMTRGGEMLLVGVKKNVVDALELSGLKDAVELCATRQQALKQFSSRRWY